MYISTFAGAKIGSRVTTAMRFFLFVIIITIIYYIIIILMKMIFSVIMIREPRESPLSLLRTAWRLYIILYSYKRVKCG